MIPARLLEVDRTTPRTRWLRLSLDGPLSFRAGQAVFASLSGSTTRAAYSIASPPALGLDRRIDLLIAAEGAFGVAGVDPLDMGGQTVDIDGPIGQFGVPDDAADAPLLLVAGGTGIAPIRSVILDRVARGATAPMTLVYSARTPDEFACGDELLALSTAAPLEVHLTVTRDDGTPVGRARTGRVNDALLRAALPSPDALCLVCGPSGFVQTSVATLTAMGIGTEKIVLER
ncbi:MAG: FAD-dependent oxidoreductase [Vicinamibacterales bacterium]